LQHRGGAVPLAGAHPRDGEFEASGDHRLAGPQRAVALAIEIAREGGLRDIGAFVISHQVDAVVELMDCPRGHDVSP